MLGIIVQVVISWLLIWFFEKRNLSVLGLRPTKKRVIDFFLFFSLTTAFCTSGFVMKMFWGNQSWELNPELSANLILSGLWWNMKSVLFEELIFRGVVLYILIRKLGSIKAIFLSSIAFGFYHWFSFGIFGQIAAMTITFFMTATMGLLLAYAFAKSHSLYIPIAIHLGWNFIQIFVFSQGPIGNGILVQINAEPFRTDSYFIFFAASFLPILLMLSINYVILKNRRQENFINAA